MYQSLARWCFRHRWLVVAFWILALIGTNVAGAAVGAAFNSEFDSLDSDSARGFEVLNEYFEGAGSGFGGALVFESIDGFDDPEMMASMNALFDEVAAIEDLTVVSPFSPLGAGQISPDGTIAFAQINLSARIDETEGARIGKRIVALTEPVAAQYDGLSIEVGGAALGEFDPPQSELIGLAFAIVVLVLAFGSVLAMGLPVGIALAGVGTGGFGLVNLLTNAFSIPEFAPLIGVMIGLGVGIDYALFIVTRYRELSHAGASPEQAVVGAMDTAGRAVVFAGITVVLSLLGMLLIGLSFVTGLGIAAATTVAVTLAASITLLPALLSITHANVEVTRWRGLITAGFAAIALLGVGLGVPVISAVGAGGAALTLLASFVVPALRRVVPPRRPKPVRETLSYRWSRAIQARPWRFVLVGGGILLLLTAPVFGLRLGFSDEGNFSPDTTTRRAYDLIAEGFGPGFNGPIIVAITVDDPTDITVVQTLAARLAEDPGVAQVSPPFPSDRALPQSS